MHNSICCPGVLRAQGVWGEALPPPHAHRAGKGDLYRGWAAHRTVHDAMEKSFLLCW